ncbi:MAG: hypothetical protein ACI8QZ_004042 [Chlamydiales bacterium]|jgi:hypothetical protein
MALFIGWAVSRTGPAPTAAFPSPATSDPAGPAGSRNMDAPTGTARTQSPKSRAGQLPDPARGNVLGEDFAKAYVGHGVIRGRVQVSAGLDFPERWELVLEPARFLEGREKAVSRVITITKGEREFEVTDLPLGGYDVSARSAGMNGNPVPVLLYTVAGRPDLPGARYSYVILDLTPAGFVDGSIVNGRGMPVGDLPVSLTSPKTHEVLETTTDPAGNFIFPLVLDGEYEILFGDPDRPLRPVEWFTFKAPSMRYPEREVPAFVDVTFSVFDERRHPLADASVRGYGDPGGTIDLVTDMDGSALARFLAPGRYRVKAKDRAGQLGKVDFEIFANDGTKQIEIVTKP